jgi:hypothetical protein
VAVFWLLVGAAACKALWGIWRRDLTFGDTSWYFLNALKWADEGRVNIVWSPLYTAYFGAVSSVFPNAVVAVLVHRVLLAFATLGLVAWTARRVLPSGLALLAAVWWIALPIHYDTLYEVHLFGALVPLVALLIVTWRSEWQMPLLVAWYGLATVLMRNENVLCVATLLALWLYRSHGNRRLSRVPADAPPRLPGVGGLAASRHAFPGPFARVAILALGVALACGFFYQRSYVHSWEDISSISDFKHRLNMCQVYAFGYQQRHPEWTNSAWTECQPLMKAEFGSEMPSLGEMLKSNPAATLRHFWWNLSLAPAGLQVLFFNASAFQANPDYADVTRLPVAMSALTLAVLLVGGISLWILVKRRRSWNAPRLRRFERDYLVLFVANLVTALAVILTQRPRPSYLLGFAAICMIGYLYVARQAFRPLLATINPWIVVSTAAFIAVLPSYPSLERPSMSGRLTELYQTFGKHNVAICAPQSLLIASNYAEELRHYVCRSRDVPAMASLGNIADMDARSLVLALEQARVGGAMLDAGFLAEKTKLEGCDALDDAFSRAGWSRLVISRHANGFCDAAYTRDLSRQTVSTR